MVALPAAASERGVVTAGHSTTSTTTSIASATTATAAPATSTAAATEASHLGETRVNLLLCLSEDVDEITSLLGVCCTVSSDLQMKLTKHLLSVVKRVMAVPLAPARPVRPIRWM